MNPELEERLKARFHTFDRNDNGYLEGADFDSEVDQILAATGVAAESPIARLLRAAYQAYWWAMLVHLDLNRDSKISFEEYAQIVHRIGEFKSYAKARADAVDRFTDLNGDGWIERDDYMTVMLAARFAEAAAAAAYDSLGPDQNGRISAGRFAGMIMDFYDQIGDAGAAQKLVPTR